MIAIAISDVHPDPVGPDREKNRNIKLNQEWIQIKNVGDEPFVLNGRCLVDRTLTNTHRHKIVFSLNPEWTLPIGQRITIFTGKKDAENDPDPIVISEFTWHIEYGNYIWNNTGDTAEIYANEADFNIGRAPLAKRSL
jgi:hypothetical protein